jgi:hypothetical protein
MQISELKFQGVYFEANFKSLYHKIRVKRKYVDIMIIFAKHTNEEIAFRMIFEVKLQIIDLLNILIYPNACMMKNSFFEFYELENNAY